MIGSTRNLRVLAYPAPADLRKGYNGLSGLVLQDLGRDPLSGDCYLFVNRKRKAAKVLMWDGTGLCIFQKRLEHGRFAALWRRKWLILPLMTLGLGAALVAFSQVTPRWSSSVSLDPSNAWARPWTHAVGVWQRRQ